MRRAQAWRAPAAAALLGSLLLDPSAAQTTRPPPTTMDASTMAQDDAAIRTTLAAYNAALNGGAVSAVLPLYTEDGICMAPFSPPSIGQAALRNAYEGFFREMTFDVKFDIAEVSVVAPDWAFARTASTGTTLHRSTGRSVSEANQELFVLRKGTDGAWRIARYSFSPTNPPAG